MCKGNHQHKSHHQPQDTNGNDHVKDITSNEKLSQPVYLVNPFTPSTPTATDLTHEEHISTHLRLISQGPVY